MNCYNITLNDFTVRRVTPSSQSHIFFIGISAAVDNFGQCLTVYGIMQFCLNTPEKLLRCFGR